MSLTMIKIDQLIERSSVVLAAQDRNTLADQRLCRCREYIYDKKGIKMSLTTMKIDQLIERSFVLPAAQDRNNLADQFFV